MRLSLAYRWTYRHISRAQNCLFTGVFRPIRLVDSLYSPIVDPRAAATAGGLDHEGLRLRGRSQGSTALGGGRACRTARLAGDCGSRSASLKRPAGRAVPATRSARWSAWRSPSSMYAIPTWTRTVRLVAEHAALRAALGCEDATPSEWACYRFTAQAARLQAAAGRLHRGRARPAARREPRHGREHRHRRLGPSRVRQRAAVRVQERARARDERVQRPRCIVGAPLRSLDAQGRRVLRLQGPRGRRHAHRPSDGVDGRDGARLPRRRSRSGCSTRCASAGSRSRTRSWTRATTTARSTTAAWTRGVCPVTPLRQTPAVKRGDHKPRCCEHGEWTFAGTDYKRQATKWRCPTGECKPKSTWVKADRLHPLIPRHTDAVQGALQQPWSRRARVRTAQARMVAAAAARAWDRARAAARRPDDPREARDARSHEREP